MASDTGVYRQLATQWAVEIANAVGASGQPATQPLDYGFAQTTEGIYYVFHWAVFLADGTPIVEPTQAQLDLWVDDWKLATPPKPVLKTKNDYLDEFKTLPPGELNNLLDQTATERESDLLSSAMASRPDYVRSLSTPSGGPFDPYKTIVEPVP